jgi:hypothetical protein
MVLLVANEVQGCFVKKNLMIESLSTQCCYMSVVMG